MCVYVLMYVCMCVYVRMCMYVYICMYVYVYMYVCVYVYVYLFVYVCMGVYVYVRVCVYLCVCYVMCVCIHVYMCVYMRVCMCDVRTYMCARVFELLGEIQILYLNTKFSLIKCIKHIDLLTNGYWINPSLTGNELYCFCLSFSFLFIHCNFIWNKGFVTYKQESAHHGL